ncbi:hypothetical protein GCM10017608_10670 [Agromyces luteolus]|uniref:Uncharacterized protein n=1 Tax=Agromyces luteolus TaxID=88373 RepID=A0A7C9M007_9MICO|nr:hypothetical protein [Agromyces luteolus]MUN08597.1 hypothetical protein [Agromyces luteolus]GLK27134.1 hypothetical protein GCM10017608_10670 [Agromyces luteolus]
MTSGDVLRAPLRVGARILLAPEHTGLMAPAWAVVELVDRIEDPTPLPWSAGADHRWRVGYRTTVVDSRGDVDEPLGLIWVDDDARDANGMLLSADRS